MKRPQPTDEQYREAMYRTFDLADELMSDTADGTLWPDVLDGSQMALDDSETDPHQMAHVIQGPLNNAIEHLHATAALVRKTALLHNGPPFTLCRTAVESAATAYWMLVPTERKQRLKNHLIYVRQDTFDYEQVSHLVAERMKQRKKTDTFGQRRDWAVKAKEKHHITGLPNKLEYERMIVEVDKAIALQDGGENDHHIETYWKTASAFGHGRQWAMLNVLVREEVVPLGNATASIKLGNTDSRVMWGSAAAYELINRSLSLYYMACGHEPEAMEPIA
jgi:hypothetical protein